MCSLLIIFTLSFEQTMFLIFICSEKTGTSFSCTSHVSGFTTTFSRGCRHTAAEASADKVTPQQCDDKGGSGCRNMSGKGKTSIFCLNKRELKTDLKVVSLLVLIKQIVSSFSMILKKMYILSGRSELVQVILRVCL